MNSYKVRKIKTRTAWAIAMILAFFWTIVTVLPFLYMVVNSFKEQSELMNGGVFTLPQSWYPVNYIEVLQGDFWRYFLNSVVVLAVSLILLLVLSAMASYPLARMKFPFSTSIFQLIVACMSIPIHVTLIPIFRMSTKIGIYDTVWALVGPYVAFGVPISVFILTGFMKEIPIEIEEASMLDGCSKFKAFFHVMLPMSKPGLATLAIYNGVNMWNEFSFAYTLTQSAVKRTLPLSIWEYKGQYRIDTPMILTVLTLTLLPMLIMFILSGDKLIEGMAAGAVKG